MIQVKMLTFNAFQENTYVVYNAHKEAIIIDPGCNTESEKEVLFSFIETNGITPIHLVNTHCHIDHILGNKFISERYNLKLMAHNLEEPILASGSAVSNMYGILYDPSPEIEIFLNEGDDFYLGDDSFELFLCPGHSPGSLCFYNSDSKILIGGDVLFQGSIGRTDLPGGDFNTIIKSIKQKLFRLPDETTIYCGHGPNTTIGFEKRTNPFLT